MAKRESGNPKDKITAKIFHSRWMKAVSVMAGIVVFCTTYALILPAITMSAQDAKCGNEEHTHVAECYDAEGNIICGIEEHVHSLECYSDLYADIENPDEWSAEIPALSGERNANVVDVAWSQIGYRESDSNYLVSDGDQTQGYTRYGHWYGDVIDGSGERLENGLSSFAYADWDAMFVSFVLDNAGVYDFGYDYDAGNWAGALAMSGKYVDSADYTPKAGDLIFFTPSADSKVQVGIVTDINKGFLGIFGNKINSLSVIIGNSDNSVEEIKVSLEKYEEGSVVFEKIHGYGVLSGEEQPMDYSVTEEITDSTLTGAGVEVEVPVDEATADMNVNSDERSNVEVTLTDPMDIAAVEQTEVSDGTNNMLQEEDSMEIPGAGQEENAVDASTIEQAEEATAISATEQTEELLAVPPTEQTEESVAVSTTEQVEEVADVSEEEQDFASAGDDPAGEAVDEQNTDAQENVLQSIAENTEHIIGMSADDLATSETTESDSVNVILSDAMLTEDASAILMNWQVKARLTEDVLPTDAIIRVNTATGKSHAMTAEQVKAWGGAVSIGNEDVVLVDNENYEVTFIANNGNLYTWDNVQNMTDSTAVTFSGLHVRVLNDVTLSAEGNTIEFSFETTAKLADANVGQNYYVTKVDIQGFAGTDTYIYKNGEAEPVDQNEILRDAGLNKESEVFKTLEYKGSDYSVTMSYGIDAKIPDVAKLKVTEIKKGTEAYDRYIEETKAVLGIEDDSYLGLYGRFFDIKIMTKDGEFTPAVPVKVDIVYGETITDVEESAFSGVHFAKNGAEEVAVEPVGENGCIESVGFEAESFSIYGIVYTVDFARDGYEYSIGDNHEILVSMLLPKLGIDEEIKNISNVTIELKEQRDETVDPSEVYVEKIQHDWAIKSDVAFGNVYTLKIVTKEGVIYLIDVTDETQMSLNPLCNGLSISGATDNGDGSYTVKPNIPYEINLTFKETEENQFDDDGGWMTYTLPTGATAANLSETDFDITGTDLGIGYTVSGNKYKIVDNVVWIKFNTEDPNFSKLNGSTGASFDVDFTASFGSDQNDVVFTADGNGKAKVDTTPSVDIQKDIQSINFATGEVTYTLKVYSTGNNTSIDVTDVFEGTAIEYKSNTVTVKNSNGGDITNNCDVEDKPNGIDGFSLTIPSMSDGDVYTINYNGQMNISQLTPNGDGSYGVKTDTNNKVTYDNDKTKEKDLGNVIKAPSLSKKNTGVSETVQNGKRTLTWSLEAMSSANEDGRLKWITDTIDASSDMEYSGTKIHIVAYDVDSETIVREGDVLWNAPGMTKSNKTWTYDITQFTNNTNKNIKYTITYTTDANVSNIVSDTKVYNDTHDNRGKGDRGEGTVGPEGKNKLEVTKTSIETTSETVKWRVTIHVPAIGLSPAVFKDVLPNALPYNTHGNDTVYQDTYVDGTFRVVSRLEDGEDWSIDTTNSNSKQLVVNFTYNGQPGLKGTGAKRDIVVELETKNDQNWLTDAETGVVTPVHTNTAYLNEINGSNDAYPVKSVFDKVGEQKETVNASSTDTRQVPKYEYGIIMNGLTASLFADSSSTIVKDDHDGKGKYIEITDKYDERLEYIPRDITTAYENSGRVYGGDANSQSNTIGWGSTEDAYYSAAEVNDTDHTITFKVYQSALPMNGSDFYTYYRLKYYMKVKDYSTYETMRKQAIQSANKYVELKNEATSLLGSDKCDVKYQPPVLNKEVTNLNALQNGSAGMIGEFKITVNPEAFDLYPNTDVFEMTDTLLQNLSVRYQDITITCDKTVPTVDIEGKPTTAPYFNMEGNEVKFYLPDEAAVVITYKGTVRGEPDNEGRVTFKNNAHMEGWDSSVEKWAKNTGSGHGAASNPGVYLYKCDENVNSTKLQGAVFKVFEVTEYRDGKIISAIPLKKKDKVTDYTVETLENGIATVQGHAVNTGWNLKAEKRYYLEEVVAPPGYAINSQKYEFVISKDGTVNYKAVVDPVTGAAPWTFYDGDTVTVKDKRLKGVLTLTKSLQDDEGNPLDESKLDDSQKAKIKFIVSKQNPDTGDYEEIKTVTYNEFYNGSYTIGDLEAGTYRVVEEVNDTTCITKTYSVEQSDDVAAETYATVVISEDDVTRNVEHKVGLANEYDIPGTFRIYKHATGETDYHIAGAEFTVYNVNGTSTGKKYSTDAQGILKVLQTDGLAENTVYYLQESNAPIGFQENETKYYFYFSDGSSTVPADAATYNAVRIVDGDVVDQSIADDIGTKTVEVEKVWYDEYLQETSDPEGITSIQVIIKQTGSYDKEGRVVKETKQFPDNTTTYTASKQNDGKWKLDQPLEFPSMAFEAESHMPIYYSYEAEEIVPEGYTATYETSEADGVQKTVITNTPINLKASTELNVSKVWMNNSGTEDITDSMTDADPITVNVYRKTGKLNVGKVVKGSTEYPASNLVELKIKGNDHATLNTGAMICMPGDVLRFTIEGANGLNLGVPNGFEIVSDEGTKKVYNWTVPDNVTEVTINEWGSHEYSVSVENTTASSWTQVLTQDELKSLSAGLTPIKSLSLKPDEWTASTGTLPVGDGTNAYSYFIVEPNGDTFKAEYSIAGDGTITLTNYDTKKLEVDKTWLDSNGDDITENIEEGTIVYNLYQVAKETRPIFSVDTSGLKWETWGPSYSNMDSLPTLTVKKDGALQIVFTSTDQHNGKLTGTITVTGATLDTQASDNEGKWNPSENKNIRTVVIKDVTDNVVISGNIFSANKPTVNMTVTATPDDPDPVTEEHYTDTKVATITVTADTASIALESAFAESGITVKNGTPAWSALIDKLPENGKVGNNYYDYTYYLTEEEVSGFSLESITPNNVQTGSTIVVSNKQSTVSIKAEKVWYKADGTAVPAAEQPNATVYAQLIQVANYTPVTAGAPSKDADETVYSVGCDNVANGWYAIRNNDGNWSRDIEGLPVSSTVTVTSGQDTYVYKANYTYRLVETSIVNANGSTTDYPLTDFIISYTFKDSEGEEVSGVESVGSGTIQINNKRVETFELPNTGGIGTDIYRTAGIVMIITALLGIIFKKRCERKSIRRA